MSIFGSIMSAIFGKADASAASAASDAPAGGAPGIAPAQGAGSPNQPVDVEAVLTERAKENKERLDWRRSIVDLMKLLGLDSSFGARKQLAQELGYTGDSNDSAAMNAQES